MSEPENPDMPPAPGETAFDPDAFLKKFYVQPPSDRTIAELLIEGMSQKDIAFKLGHNNTQLMWSDVQIIFDQFGVSTREQLILKALRASPEEESVVQLRCAQLQGLRDPNERMIIRAHVSGLTAKEMREQLGMGLEFWTKTLDFAKAHLNIGPHDHISLLRYALVAETIAIKGILSEDIEADLVSAERQRRLSALVGLAKDVATLICQRLPNEQIATALGISTAEACLQAAEVYKKLGAPKSKELKRAYIIFCFQTNHDGLLQNPFESLDPDLLKILPGLLGTESLVAVQRQSGLATKTLLKRAKDIYRETGVPGRDGLRRLAARLGVLGEYVR